MQDILSQLPTGDPENEHRLQEQIILLHQRIDRKESVSDAEVVGGIWNRFELNSSTDCLFEVPWLMRNLSFTSLVISDQDIPTAWRQFQSAAKVPLGRTDYPVLESMASWYFNQREAESFELHHMVIHAAAMYEFMLQELWGYQSDEEYGSVFTDSALSAFYLSYGLKLAERSKFLARVLELEFLHGRLSDEDFNAVQEMLGTINRIETTNEEETRRILQLQWDTITDRDRKIRELEAKLEGLTSQPKYVSLIEQSASALAVSFGYLWNRLQSQTRRYLALSHAFGQEPLSSLHPDVPAWALFRAINSELEYRLFKPHGLLDPALIKRASIHTPIALLIEFQRNVAMDGETRMRVSRALDTVGGESKLLTPNNIRQLRLLREHRNWGEHPLGKPRRYSPKEYEWLRHSLIKSSWVTSILRQICMS